MSEDIATSLARTWINELVTELNEQAYRDCVLSQPTISDVQYGELFKFE